MTIRHCLGYKTLFEQKKVFRSNATAVGTLGKAITNSKIHKKLLQILLYLMTLCHG